MLSPESRSTCRLTYTERSWSLLRCTSNKTVYFLKNPLPMRVDCCVWVGERQDGGLTIPNIRYPSVSVES
jgi:hypothetical protein